MKTISNEELIKKYNYWIDKPYTVAEREFRVKNSIGSGFHGGYTTAMADVQVLIDKIKESCETYLHFPKEFLCTISELIKEWEDM